MKKISILLLCICTINAAAQTDSLQATNEIIAFQKKLNDEYKDPDESPIEGESWDLFTGHDFFPINLEYRVNAKLTVTQGTPFFGMKTTTGRLSTERVYGYVAFTLRGKDFRLPVYQSKDLMADEEYADYLFFPFTDATNGNETYGGGRYIDLRIPKSGGDLVIDFNMAYNPYCAYSAKYSCPLVPAENQIDIAVPAGVKYHKIEKTESPGPADSVQNEDEVFVKVDVVPEYPGGYEAMIKFISKNMSYPKAAVKNKLQGTVYVQFVVERDGTVSSIKTIRGISSECDQEAERVVSLMPRWTPGKKDGKDVPVRFVLPIKFKGSEKWNKR